MKLISSIFTLITWLVVLHLASADDKKVTSPCLCLKKVVGQLHSPVEYVTVRRNNSLLTLVVEQRGVVRAFLEEHKERSTVFMDIRDRVTTSDRLGEERGLLSLVLHPHYNQSRRGRVFAYYVTTTGSDDKDRAVVSEFQAFDDVVDVTSEQQLLRIDQPTARANGGQLLFGDDGYLYIFTGDGSGHNESVDHAQDLQSFLGKALRVDVDQQGFQGGESARAYLYDIPGSNPFRDRPNTRGEIFALGFFNPWRCSQDSASRGGSGAIFCGDTGSDLFEEVNIITKGRNYGWNLKEGNHCFNPANCSQIENEGVPIHIYPNNPDFGSAVVGGFVYRGANFSSLVGDYVFGDAVKGELNTLREDEGRTGTWKSRPWHVCPEAQCPCHARDPKQPFLLAFGLDPNGELMLLMTSEFSVLRPKGSLYRVIAPTGTEKKGVTCGSAPVFLTKTISTPLFLTLVSLLPLLLDLLA